MKWFGSSGMLLAMTLALAVGLAQKAMAEETITVLKLGGTTEKVLDEVLYKPFTEETGTKIIGINSLQEELFARMTAEVSNPSVDLYHYTGGQEFAAKQLGLTANVGDLDGANIPPKFRDPDGQWVWSNAVPSGIIYNTQVIATPPDSLDDLFKEEYRGKVGLPSMINIKGVHLMLMLANKYGGSIDNVEPGIRKIKELVKAGAKFYDTAAQMQSLFAQNEIVITYYDLGNSVSAAARGIPVKFAKPKEGMSAQFYSLMITKNSKHSETARKLINMALRPDVQEQLARRLYWSPVNLDTKIPDDLKETVLSGSEAMEKFVVFDHNTVKERRGEWMNMFDRIMRE